jgi:hypothetical protein
MNTLTTPIMKKEKSAAWTRQEEKELSACHDLCAEVMRSGFGLTMEDRALVQRCSRRVLQGLGGEKDQDGFYRELAALCHECGVALGKASPGGDAGPTSLRGGAEMSGTLSPHALKIVGGMFRRCGWICEALEKEAAVASSSREGEFDERIAL